MFSISGYRLLNNPEFIIGQKPIWLPVGNPEGLWGLRVSDEASGYGTGENRPVLLST